MSSVKFPNRCCMKNLRYTVIQVYIYENKKLIGLNGHLSIKDSTLTSCQNGSYLHTNSPINKMCPSTKTHALWVMNSVDPSLVITTILSVV